MEPNKSDELVCEFERNFVYSTVTEEKLLSLGARVVTNLTLIDSYYDTCNNVVCLNNHWLRNRNQRWELKYCPLDQAPSAWNQATGDNVTKYLEEVDADKIKLVLCDLFLKQGGGQATCVTFADAAARMCSLDECIVNADLKCFASFTTFRKVYHHDDLTVNLDRTDFGICVGEIEMTVNPSQGITSLEVKAKQKIEEFGKKLGIEWKKTPGKLEMYLIENNRKLYDQLIDAKVLFKA